MSGAVSLRAGDDLGRSVAPDVYREEQRHRGIRLHRFDHKERHDGRQFFDRHKPYTLSIIAARRLPGGCPLYAACIFFRRQTVRARTGPRNRGDSYRAAFSPDARTLAIATRKGYVWVHNLAPPEIHHRFCPHHYRLVAVSEDCKHVYLPRLNRSDMSGRPGIEIRDAFTGEVLDTVREDFLASAHLSGMDEVVESVPESWSDFRTGSGTECRTSIQ